MRTLSFFFTIPAILALSVLNLGEKYTFSTSSLSLMPLSLYSVSFVFLPADHLELLQSEFAFMDAHFLRDRTHVLVYPHKCFCYHLFLADELFRHLYYGDAAYGVKPVFSTESSLSLSLPLSRSLSLILSLPEEIP